MENNSNGSYFCGERKISLGKTRKKILWDKILKFLFELFTRSICYPLLGWNTLLLNQNE